MELVKRTLVRLSNNETERFERDFVVLFCTLLRRSVEHYHQEPNMFEHIVHLQSLHINWGATEVGQPPHA
jgi:hypothetical protein